MTREEANIHWHCQADENEPHPQSDSEHLRVGSIMVSRASVQDENLVHVDAHVTQLMLKSCPGHEREQSLGQALTSAGGFVFVVFGFF